MTRAILYVIDDNAGVRRSLELLGGTAGLTVEAYSSSEEFLRGYDSTQVGCLVLDLRLAAGKSGLEIQKELQRRGASLPIIVMTGYPTVDASVEALKGGAFDFLRKPVHPKKLLERIQAAIDTHERALNLAGARHTVEERLALLTPRERQVTALLAEGRASKEIADTLRLSVRTVEGHRYRILKKTQAPSFGRLIHDIASIGGLPNPRSRGSGNREES